MATQSVNTGFSLWTADAKRLEPLIQDQSRISGWFIPCQSLLSGCPPSTLPHRRVLALHLKNKHELSTEVFTTLREQEFTLFDLLKSSQDTALAVY